MLQEGIDAQYAGGPSNPTGGSGQVARRKATFAEGIATASAFADRMEEIRLIEIVNRHTLSVRALFFARRRGRTPIR